MKRISAQNYLTVKDLKKRIRDLNAHVAQLKGEQWREISEEINWLHDAKRWLRSGVAKAERP